MDSRISLKEVRASLELPLEEGALKGPSWVLLRCAGRVALSCVVVFGPKDSLFLMESVRVAPMLFCLRS